MTSRQSLGLRIASLALLALATTSVASAQCVCSAGTCGQTIIGTGGNDTLYGSTVLNDCVYGLAGADTIYTYTGDDFIDGGDGSDTLLNSGDGTDCVCGGYGDDNIDGRDGTDTLDGLQDNDWLHGGGMADFLYGYDGNDNL